MALVDDAPVWKRDPVEQARQACDGGVAAIQLRAKFATDQQTLAWAFEIRELTRVCGVWFFVNDRFDLALAAGADGVHLGQDDLAGDRLPTAARERLRVGRSTHSDAQVEAALRESADYLAFGPVFETGSKQSEFSPRGLSAIARVVNRAAPTPVVAIGGIDTANAAAVAATGVSAVAVISVLAAADDPTEIARELGAGLRAGSKATS
jgi:thiamine-phosphate pyrophosphorylase